MCYHSDVVFTAAGGKQGVTEERRGNTRHSQICKIHTLGLSVFTTHTRAEQRREQRRKNSFQYKWKASRECVCVCVSLYRLLNIIFLFFLLAPWKYPAQAPRRVLPGSQDVNVNFLPVAKETLSHRGPGSLPHGHHAFSQRALSVSSLLGWRRRAIRH